MQAAEGRRARVAAMSTASALGLAVDDAVVLSDSNRLVVRLMPCDVVARIAPSGYRVFAAAVGAERELEVGQWPPGGRGPRGGSPAPGPARRLSRGRIADGPVRRFSA